MVSLGKLLSFDVISNDQRTVQAGIVGCGSAAEDFVARNLVAAVV